jgi:hypothetical protein
VVFEPPAPIVEPQAARTSADPVSAHKPEARTRKDRRKAGDRNVERKPCSSRLARWIPADGSGVSFSVTLRPNETQAQMTKGMRPKDGAGPKIRTRI